MDIPRLRSREPCVIKRGAHKRTPQKYQGSASWSLVWLARDSQGVLPSRRLGAVSDGCHRGTLSLHVLVQGQSIEETLRATTSTDKLEVKVLPHVAESRVRVLVNNSTVGTESELSAPPIKAKRLPHEALVTVEVRQKLGKEERATGRYFCKPSRVYRGTQSAGVVNWSRGHSMRRPSLLRIGSQ